MPWTETSRLWRALGLAIRAGVEPVLLEPGDREAGLSVEVALLLERNSSSSALMMRSASRTDIARIVRLQHLLVAREHSHAGADRGLRHVDRCDRALL